MRWLNVDKNNLVTKANSLITAHYDLSGEEQKIILTLASLVQPSDEEFKPYQLKIKDFMNLLGISTKTKYTEIPKITKDLMKKVFEIRDGRRIIQLSWLSSVIYEEGSGTVTLCFDPNLKPYMLKLNELFTSYRLENVLNLKSKYSIRLYEVLKGSQFKKQGYEIIKLEELKALLGIGANEYPRFYDLKLRVLNQAKKELCTRTDICFEFEEIKTGKKITAIKFYINENKVLDEISVTSADPEEMKLEEGIQAVIKIMDKHTVKPAEAMKIWNSANGDIRLISKVYNHFKNKAAKNFIGLMIDMVKPGAFHEPIKNGSNDNFSNYEQRQHKEPDYMDKLERRLLGWDNPSEVGGEIVEQSHIDVDE